MQTLIKPCQQLIAFDELQLTSNQLKMIRLKKENHYLCMHTFFFFFIGPPPYLPFLQAESEQKLLSQCELFGPPPPQILPLLLQSLRVWTLRSQFLHWIPTPQIIISTSSLSYLLLLQRVRGGKQTGTSYSTQYKLDGLQNWSSNWTLIIIDLVKEIVNEGKWGNCLHSPPQCAKNQKLHSLYCFSFKYILRFTHLL